MPAIDLAAAREQAAAKKDEARQKIASAKREAEQRKALKATPVPAYVSMPAQSGDAEADSLKDLGELELGFRRRAADEGRRFALTTDSEYWAALCFQTRAQKEAFFAAMGVLDLGNGARYFDGNAIAARLGIQLPEESVPFRADRKPDPTWVAFTED